MVVLGISAYYHDSAAALIVDGKVTAAICEERLSRTKHDKSFPKRAIAFCVEYSGITYTDIDYVVFYLNYSYISCAQWVQNFCKGNADMVKGTLGHEINDNEISE